MSRITNHRLGELIQQLFLILQEHPDGLKARDALNTLANSVTLTEYESGAYESGRRFEKIVRFATIDTVRAGWMVKDTGVWSITDEGSNALKNFPDPLGFHKAASKLYQNWRKNNKKQNASLEVAQLLINDEAEIDDESEKDVSVSYEEAKEHAQQTIDEYLHAMNGYEFQKLVADLLQAMDYHVTWIAPPGKDGGVDIIAYTDPLGTQGPRIKVQVKQQQKAVSGPDLKSFMANIGQNDSGIYVCTGGFTKDAHTFARSQETKRIMLIDTDKMIKLWIEFIPKLSCSSSDLI